MEADKGKVVTFHYKVRDAEGSFTESSEGADPMAYLHGHRNLISGLENEIRGKSPGDSFKVSLAPEQAYGRRDETAVQRVPIKHLVRPGKLEPGRGVVVNTSVGQRQALVVKVGRFNVDVDFNHPLAGRTLEFEVEIVDVRDATEEELTHGHAHGPGGGHG
jgi:FKBP-type peptidyl-prolyl cis-trans isomerase SlyD